MTPLDKEIMDFNALDTAIDAAILRDRFLFGLIGYVLGSLITAVVWAVSSC